MKNKKKQITENNSKTKNAISDNKQVKHLENFVGSIVDTIPGSFYWKDKEGRYLGCNNVVLTKGNFKTKADIIGKTDYDLWPERADAIRKNDLEVMQKNKPMEMEETVTLPTGEYFCFASVKSPLKNENGEIIGVIGNSLDITELKEAKERAEIANKAKSEFLSVISHELRIPLTGILGMARMLDGENLTPQQWDQRNDILKASNYLLSIVSDILNFTKLEAGKLDLNLAQLDFRKLIEETATMLSSVVKEKKLELLVNYDPNAPYRIISDSRALHHILLNLINNALKFTHKGYIWIKVECHKKSKQQATLLLSVEDSGIGIPQDKQNMIFERFSQVDTSNTRRYGGTGLGLAITKSCIEMLNGTISVKSQVGKGSTFTCAIPVQLETSMKKESPWEVYRSKVKVLVVDDTLHGEVLCRHIASSFCELTSGKDALHSICAAQQLAEPFDIVIINRQLIDQDALRLAKTIQQQSKLHQPMLMLVTDKKTISIQIKAKAAGFFNCLVRPIHPTELLINLTAAWQKWSEKNTKKDTSTAVFKTTNKNKSLVKKKYSSDNRSSRILLVGDDPIIQKVHVMMFEKIGFIVDVAKNGRQALQMAAENYVAIFMDIGLPDLDGFAVTQKIRRREKKLNKKHTPIIGLTGYGDEENIKRCIEAGMDATATKPVKLEKIKYLTQTWIS